MTELIDLIVMGLLDRGASNTLEVRLEAFKDYLATYFEVDVRRLMITSFWERYAKYIASEKESLTEYTIVTEQLKNVLGEKVFQDILNHTRFLHRTLYLEKVGLEDEVSLEPLPF